MGATTVRTCCLQPSSDRSDEQTVTALVPKLAHGPCSEFSQVEQEETTLHFQTQGVKPFSQLTQKNMHAISKPQTAVNGARKRDACEDYSLMYIGDSLLFPFHFVENTTKTDLALMYRNCLDRAEG